VLVPEMNAGQLSLEVKRILGDRQVDAIHRFNGEPITPAEIAERAESLVKGAAA
jgi:2-oxoglutarate ferredoxin oxidoreductase subunit alpha